MKLFAWTVLASLCAASAALPQHDDSILAQARAKCRRFESGLQDMKMVQEMRTLTSEGTMVSRQTIYRKGKKLRMEMDMPVPEGETGPVGGEKFTNTVIDDGTDTWIVSTMTGKQKLPPEEREAGNEEWACGALADTSARITGSDNAQGRGCYLVVVAMDSMKQTLWLDKEKLAVIQGEGIDGTDTIRWVQSDFRDVGAGLEFPFKTEMFSGGQVVNSMTVTDLEIDRGLSDDLFDASKIDSKGPSLMDMYKQMLDEKDSTESDSAPVPAEGE